MFSMRACLRVCIVAVVLALPSIANAAALVFNPQPLVPGGAYPDIRTNATLLDYSTAGVCPFMGAGPGCLQITGTNLNITRFNGDAGVPFSPMTQPGDIFTLFANIDTGGIFHGGTLLIKGGLAGPLPFTSADGTTLLSGALTQFGLVPGMSGAGAVLDFLASVADPLGLGFGTLVGVQISTNSFTGANPFSTNFHQQGAVGIAAIDTFRQVQAVPEPGSFVLLATGGALLILRRRFRRRP